MDPLLIAALTAAFLASLFIFGVLQETFRPRTRRVEGGLDRVMLLAIADGAYPNARISPETARAILRGDDVKGPLQ